MQKFVDFLKNAWKKVVLALTVAVLTVLGCLSQCVQSVEDTVKKDTQELVSDHDAGVGSKKPDLSNLDATSLDAR